MTGRPLLVSEYTVDRLYGGPEEGGWWYDDWEPTGNVAALVFDQSAAHAVAGLLSDRAAAAKTKPDRFSVIGTPDTIYAVERTVGEHRTTERPHYE